MRIKSIIILIILKNGHDIVYFYDVIYDDNVVD